MGGLGGLLGKVVGLKDIVDKHNDRRHSRKARRHHKKTIRLEQAYLAERNRLTRVETARARVKLHQDRCEIAFIKARTTQVQLENSLLRKRLSGKP